MERKVTPDIINPYDTPGCQAETNTDPILFQGTITIKDLPPPDFGWKLCLFSSLFAIGLVGHLVQAVQQARSTTSLPWTGLGCVLVLPWLAFGFWLLGSRRKLKSCLSTSQEIRGWFDKSGFAAWNNQFAWRGDWSILSIQPNIREVVVGSSIDGTFLGTLIPWRCFRELGEIERLKSTVQSHQVLQSFPELKTIQKQDFRWEEFDFAHFQNNLWSSTSWPPYSTPHEVQQFHLRTSSKNFLVICASMFVMAIACCVLVLLPIWVSLALWMAYQSAIMGGWAFLASLGAIPAYVVVVLALAFAFRFAHEWSKDEKNGLSIAFGDLGLFIGTPRAQEFHNWSNIESIQITDKSVSIRTFSHTNSRTLTAGQFENAQEFQKFCALLQRRHP